MKRYLPYLPFLILLLFLLVFPGAAFSCAASGLMLWFHTLLPSLLPFLILSGVLIATDLPSRFISVFSVFWQRIFALTPNGAYALIMGIFCGYPMGARTAADLYRESRITKKEAEYLLTFSNYPGLSFLSAYICLETLHRSDLILPSYIILYLSGWLTSLLFRGMSDMDNAAAARKETPQNSSLGEILDASIMNGFEAITKLGGYVILFSVVQGIIRKLFSGTAMYLLCGITEMSTGITALAETGWNISLLYPLTLGAASFGGLCIAAQTKSMLSGTDISFASYLPAKLLDGFLAALMAYLFIKII